MLTSLVETTKTHALNEEIEDITNATRWLISEGSSFVSEYALVADEGMTLGNIWSEVFETFGYRVLEVD